MNKGFVFGKFMPFHKGHEAMINFAANLCDELTVLICCSDKEPISSQQRNAWVTETFAGRNNIVVRVFEYDEGILPNTSVTSEQVSEIWSAEFLKLLPDHKILVTSEPYGDLVAGYMGIKHIPFNLKKDLYPVSATMIRANSIASWDYLPESVKMTYVKKVVLLGTESTGKTTLTTKLAQYFNAAAVMEAGRDLIPDSNEFTVNDLYTVAHAHALAIEKAVGNSPLLFIDTDIYITLSYGEFAFNEQLIIENRIFEANKATLYLYLNNDVPYFQDGTRLSEEDRNLLDLSHRRTLKKYGIKYIEVSGDWDRRFNEAVTLVKQMINS